MKVISGLLPETWVYFCMNNCISTTRNCHLHIHECTHFILFALLKIHPRFFHRLACGSSKVMGPGTAPRLTPTPFSGPIDMQDITVDYLNLSCSHCQVIVGLTTKNFYKLKHESGHIYYNFHFKNFLGNR